MWAVCPHTQLEGLRGKGTSSKKGLEWVTDGKNNLPERRKDPRGLSKKKGE